MGEATVVSDGQATAEEEVALATLLGEVDEPTFNNVFAFGLREIQELGTLSDTQAADELYSLALSLDRVSLVDVLRELEASRNRLLARDDRPSLIAQLLGQRHRLLGEIEDLSRSTVRYLALSSERQTLDDEVVRLEADSAQLEKQGQQLALARVLGERWQRRQAIDRQLAAMGNFDALPEGALARYERLESRLGARRRALARLKDQRRELRAQVEQLGINESLRRHCLRLEALAEQQQWIESLEGQVAKLQTEVAQLESHRDESCSELGIAPRTPGAASVPLSKRGLAELRGAAKSLRGSRREVRGLHGQTAKAQETAAAAQRQIETGLGESGHKDLTQALAEAGELVSQFRNRVLLDERLDQMTRRKGELEEQGHDQLEHQMLPAWLLAGLGSLFVLGCALVLLYLAGMLWPASLTGALPWHVAGAGGLLVAGSAVLKVAMQRRASRNLDKSRQQLRALAQQIVDAKRERADLDERLPRGGGPLVARLQTAEKTLAGLEELLPLDAQRAAAERTAESAVAQEHALRAKLRQFHAQWRRLLMAHGLPEELAPRQLREYSRRRQHLHGLHRSIDQKSEELSQRRGEYETLAGRITQLVAELGIAPRAGRPLDQLQQCLVALKEQETRLKRRDELERQMARLRRRYAKIATSADKLRRRRQSLLHAGGTSDEHEFRRRAQAQGEAQRLGIERTQVAHEISAALAGQCTEEQLAQWVSGAQHAEHREAELSESRRATATQLNAALVRRGEMNEQLKMLVEDRQLAHKKIELGVVEKRLQDALDRWRVLAICGIVLEAVRQYYEREHQPQALREASVYLERLTGGRYTRVWTPLGEHSLRVDDGKGTTLNVEVLSRGTREQLFLALRLALVGSYARRGVNLPLVLDDVLVNFDEGRAKAAAMVLRDFAKAGHQILIFTCHEHISKLFKHIKTDVRQLPDNGEPQVVGPRAAAQQVTPAHEQPVKRPRRGRVKPASQPDFAPEFDELEAEPQSVVDLPAYDEPAPPATAKVQPEPARAQRGGRHRRTPRPARRVQWSAEEFEGELSDRVRAKEASDETTGDDSEAA